MAVADPDAIDIKQVPPESSLRLSIRRMAEGLDLALDRSLPLSREVVENHARLMLEQLNLSEQFLGYAMVAVNNVFWHHQFAAVPFNRRLLCLPKCLRHPTSCLGTFTQQRLECASCSACVMDELQRTAEALGYQTLIAEGTPDVVLKIMDDQVDAILGVACLDSLEKAFQHVADLGLPHQAVPLLNDGCRDTETDPGEVIRLLKVQAPSSPAGPLTLSYVPLLRETARGFTREAIARALEPLLPAAAPMPSDPDDPMTATDAILLDWLSTGGKRLRPFATAAAYAVGRHGTAMLKPTAHLAGAIPPHIRSLCLAIEALHKASLVHDDIEDDDSFRYGRPALHRQHGVGPALNVGDYLVGLGYRLVVEEADALGADVVTDILASLLSAHMELCRGQGAELMWRTTNKPLRPIDALSIYAMKTAPAFEAALFAGLRAAGMACDRALLRRYATCLGEGYQVLNDLEDWKEERLNKVRPGQDALARRPTLLRAFAIEVGGGGKLEAMTEIRDTAEYVNHVHALYSELGVFAKAERLVDKLTARAHALADETEEPSLGDLLRFFTNVTL